MGAQVEQKKRPVNTDSIFIISYYNFINTSSVINASSDINTSSVIITSSVFYYFILT